MGAGEAASAADDRQGLSLAVVLIAGADDGADAADAKSLTIVALGCTYTELNYVVR